jgi:membrane protease YdiL (CAAX protease family)
MIGFTPIVMGLEGLMRMIDLGASIKAQQKEHDDVFKAFMDMPNLFYYLVGLVVMGITPALSEELVFRGVIMRFAQKRSTGIVTPIFISSLMFALIHADVYGFIPIFISGVLLATIYYLTRSLWCSMLAHALNNGLQVTLMYIGGNNKTVKALLDNNNVPFYILVPAVAIFAVAGWLLWKNRTPLPHDWANDFNEGQPKPTNTFSAN